MRSGFYSTAVNSASRREQLPVVLWYRVGSLLQTEAKGLKLFLKKILKNGFALFQNERWITIP